MNIKAPLVFLLVLEKQRCQTTRMILLVLCFLEILMLSSCSHSTTKVDLITTSLPTVTLTRTAQPLLTATLTSIATPSPTAALESTLLSYPTPIYVFNYPDQVTDGILLLSVEEVRNGCYKSLEPIELKFIFRNLTDEVIKIPNSFSIAINRSGDGGKLSPFITSPEGLDVYSAYDGIPIDIFPTPTNDYKTLLGNQEFEIVLIYGFPEYVIPPSPQGPNGTTVTPTPGQYFLRFYYSNSQRDIHTWDGTIGSNRIEICLIN